MLVLMLHYGALFAVWGLRIALVADLASRIIVAGREVFYISSLNHPSIPSRTSSDSPARIVLVRSLRGRWRGARDVGPHASLLAPFSPSGVYA